MAKATDCKSVIYRFESGRRLFKAIGFQSLFSFFDLTLTQIDFYPEKIRYF